MRAWIAGYPAAADSSVFLIGLLRPFALVNQSLSLWLKLIWPDLGTLECCQKLVYLKVGHVDIDERCTRMTSQRPPSGWFCNYAEFDDHRRKNSQGDDIVHETLNICAIKYVLT